MQGRVESRGEIGSYKPRSYGLSTTEPLGVPHTDAKGVTEELIRAVVVEFYRRARQDDRLGPVFESNVQDWETHLARMTDFWSAALLRTGRYSGRPVERHRSIEGLGDDHFSRWVELFETMARELCPPQEAQAFLDRARRMRAAMSNVLGLIG